MKRVKTIKSIVLAGGCFWGVEAYFKKINGIQETEVGYAMGIVDNPTYEEVCTGVTGNVEVTKVIYDETVISLSRIIYHLFNIIDPTILNRQGNDIGTQYRTGVYYEFGEDQIEVNEYIASIKDNYDKPIVVEVLPLKNFYTAEDYHQKYLDKNPTGYCHVNLNSINEKDLKPIYRK